MKALAIIFIIIAGVIGADQVSKALYPNSPLSGVQKYDPFTLLWNGTTTKATSPAFDFFDGPPGSGIQCGGGCGGAQSFGAHTLIKGETLLVVLDISGNGLSCIAISDSQGNTWTQQACLNVNGVSVIQLSTAVASTAGADTVTVANSAEFYFGTLEGFIGIQAIAGVNSFSGTTTSNSGTQSLSPTGTFSGFTFGHIIFGGTGFICANPCITSGGNLRQSFSYTGPIDVRTDDSTSSTDSWSWTGANCASGGVTCNIGQVVIDLQFSSSVACPAGYQCLFSTTDSSGNVQLNAKPQGPSTLDSFHPTPPTSMYNSDNGTSNASFFGQTFTISGSNWQIGSVQFLMNQTNAWAGAWVAQIWNIQGTAGVDGIPIGTGGNTNPSSIGLKGYPIGSSLYTSAPFTGPLTSTASTVTFSFPSGGVLSPGSYMVSLTTNSSIVSSAQFLTGNSVAGKLVTTLFGDGSPAYAGHNVYLPRTGQLIRTTKAFWFTIIGSPASAVALTSSPIDVSTSASKELFFFETWHNSTNLQTTAPWGWYITTNATLPTQANYNPLNDPSVAMANLVYPNAGATSKNYYEYQAKTGSSQNNAQGLLTSSGSGTNPYPSCPQTSTLYMCAGAETSAPGTQFLAISTTLNYTGTGANTANGGYSLFCVDTTPAADPPASAFCSSTTQTPTLSPCSASQNICATTTLPFLNMQSGPYYLGFWASSGQNATILFGTSNTGAAAQRANSVWYWVPNPPPQASPPATINEGGFFGPLIKALLGIGIWIAANVLSFFPWLASVLGPVLSQAFTILEGFFVTIFNAIGNAFGLGNVGTILQSLIGLFIIFFSSQVPALFTNLPSVFSRFFDTLSIIFPWLPNALTTAQSILLFGIKGIGFIPTIVTFAFMFVSGAFATYLIAFWFIYTGDDSLAGILALFETTEFLVFGIGVRYIAIAFNYAEDIITATIGLIPKPFVQMVAHKIPRLPIVEVNARFVWPGGSMSEIRNGNLFTVACWVTGVLFLDFYETASPSLPGSIGFLLPAAASSLAPLSGFIPLLEIMTAFTWGASFLMMPIGWFANAVDMGSLPFESAVGTKISGGFGGLQFRKAEKHFQSRLEKKIASRNPIVKEPPREVPSAEGVG